MKKTIVIIVLLLSVFTVRAQGGDSAWGLRAAFDINIPSKLGGRLNGEKLEMFRIGCGGTLGAVYTHWFGNGVFIEPGASLFYDTYSFKDLYIDAESKKPADPSLYKFGVRIPLVIGYSYDLFESMPMRVYTGPELSYAFAGKIRVKDKGCPTDFNTEIFGKDGFMNRVDCSWKIGLGVETDIATICMDVSVGMADLYKDNMTLRENRITISLLRYF